MINIVKYYTFLAIRFLSSSSQILLFTEMKTLSSSGNSFFNSFNFSSSIKSILLKTKILFWFAQISLNTSWTTEILSPTNGSLESITCNNKSDSILSSKVEENDLINFGGKSRINPIVSFRSISFHLPVTGSVITYRFQTFVHKVAKSLFSARTHFLVKPFKSEDFPAFVYPTIPTVGIHFLIRSTSWSSSSLFG